MAGDLQPDDKPLEHGGFSGWLSAAFVSSKLTPLLLIASVLLGLGAVWLLPREEEPQIRVPMIDVMVSMPGSGPRYRAQRPAGPAKKVRRCCLGLA